MSSEFSGGVQAACSVVALVFGIWAYNSWASQESAKRNADFALEAMKTGYASQRCFESAEPEILRRNFTEKELGEIIAAGETKLANCDAPISQFEALAFIAQSNLNDRTSRAINEYVRFFKSRTMNYRVIKAYMRLARGSKRTLDTGSEETREDAIFRLFEELGGSVYDPDAYSSDVKLKEKGEAWNQEARKRRLEEGASRVSNRLSRTMNERLTEYIKLRVAH